MHDRTSEKSKTHSSTCAWTYDLVIPGTKDIKKKWGFMKVSGTVDEDEQEQTIEEILSLDDELKQEKRSTG